MRLGLKNDRYSSSKGLWSSSHEAALLVSSSSSNNLLNIFVCQISLSHLTYPEWFWILTHAPTAKPAPLSDHLISTNGSTSWLWARSESSESALTPLFYSQYSIYQPTRTVPLSRSTLIPTISHHLYATSMAELPSFVLQIITRAS